jgi:hypothetical protein
VSEVSPTREEESDPVLIGGLDQFGVVTRPPGLDHSGDSRCCQGIQPVSEGEKGI